MRFESIRIDAFGRLADFDTGGAPLGPLVVVLGPNEAGKSTLFHFLTSTLYGFRPASREGNPYVPWGLDEAGGSVRLRLRDGTCVEVTRRLRSQPFGSLTVGGATEELRNRPIPWAQHVPHKVFSQVYAVTLRDLAGLDSETWAGIQDRIVGSMGASDLGSPRALAAELEGAAGTIWRPNRRGNQRLRQLKDQQQELRRRRLAAVERDQTLRLLAEEREELGERVEAARRARFRLKEQVERVESLLPVRATLLRVQELLEEAGDRSELAGLPPDPEDELRTLAERAAGLGRRLAEVDEDCQEPRSVLEDFGRRERLLVDREPEIASFLQRARSTAEDRGRTQALGQALENLERRLDATAQELLTRPWREISPGAVYRVSLPELQRRISSFAEACRTARPLEGNGAGTGQAAATPAAPVLARGVTAGGLAVAAAALLVWSFAGGGPVPLAGGSALAALAALSVLQWTQTLCARSRKAGATDPHEADAEPHLAEARTAVAALLQELPVREDLLENPSDALHVGLQRLRELLQDLDDRRRELADLESRLQAVDEEGLSLLTSLGLEGTSATDGAVAATLLERELQRALRREEAAEGASRELQRLERERRRLDVELREVEEAQASLRERLAPVGGGDPLHGAREAKRRSRAAGRAEELLQELEREHPDLDEIRQRIARAEAEGETWTADPSEVARQKAEIERLGEELQTLAAQAEALNARIRHLQSEVTVDEVDGALEALDQEVDALTRRRDRMWVLARILREADRRFRETHQPDLLRRAGAHLEHLTAGRYDRVMVDEDGDAETFQIVGPAQPAPIRLQPPVSTGTLEQAYLALRLAIVDHLDRGGEPLPLFVDEIFVNWDAGRARGGFDVLAAAAQHRQVFFFTCHPRMAETLAARGARILELDAGD